MTDGSNAAPAPGPLDASPLPRLGPRRPDAHKGEFGRVLVIGGSRGMVGAPAMAGEAALRTGAGLVTIGCPASVYPILAAKVTCPMTWPLPETEAGSLAEEAAVEVAARANDDMSALALGPGLGRHESTRRFARHLVERSQKPWVADADALFAVAENLACLERASVPGVLTPHEGEMARLLGTSAADVRANREPVARAFAARYPHVLVLKGRGTLVAQGGRLWRCSTGNPGMATGGAGDVLTGTIAALLGQGLAPYEAARLGTHVHGLAGDLARDALGEAGMIATDLIAQLPHALKLL
ncbi:MAG TPA: NAD(P)H-hydrate dehydratase [Planctomycetota bacterium]|nr:NAD(P)H-hydrate dehydratase [Planctomycetota bacterium]